MLFSRKAKGYFVSRSDQGLQVARTSSPSVPFTVEEMRECPPDAGDARVGAAFAKTLAAWRRRPR